MKNLLHDLPLFVEVARQRSFTLAADLLEMPVSTLSRRIVALEKALGASLLYRNSRHVELTEHGKTFYARCELIVSEARQACEAITRSMEQPSGWVRFSIPGDVYISFFERPLLDFAQKWPDIHLEIYFNDRLVDLHSEPYDLDLRIGELPDSDLKARRIGSGRPWIVAAPSLVEKYFLPAHPAELTEIPAITRDPHKKSWDLTNWKGETVSVKLRPAHSFNSMSAIQSFILEGLGMGLLPPDLCRPDLESGRLIRLLPDWQMPCINAYLVMPGGQVPLRVRLLIDHLVSALGR